MTGSPGTASRAFRELERACPSGAREAASSDLVDGVGPEMVVYPTSTAEVAACMRVVADHDLAVVARGAGTKLDWGAPPARLGVIIDLSGMSRILEHADGDFVVRVEAGVTLAALRTALGACRQRLAVDELVPGSTVGGVASTGASGPIRYGHGAVRDMVLGMTMVRADGVVARAGSKVVKNVAGYDLPKLLTGAYGTLGILTELTFKLKPVPEMQLFVASSYDSPLHVGPVLESLLGSQAVPVAIEVDLAGAGAPTELCVLVEGRPGPTEVRAAQLAHIMGSMAPRPDAPAWWGRLPGPVVLKVSAVISAVPRIVKELVDTCAARGFASATISGSAGAGVLYVGLPEPREPVQLNGLIADLRTVVSGAAGYVTLLRAPASAKAGVDIWGPVPGLEIMRRVKNRFDPGNRLSPGRFVGGL